MKNTSVDFQKVIYEDAEEKKTFISQQTYLYIRVTDILKFYEVFFIHFVKVFVFKKQSLYLHSSVYA